MTSQLAKNAVKEVGKVVTGPSQMVYNEFKSVSQFGLFGSLVTGISMKWRTWMILLGIKRVIMLFCLFLFIGIGFNICLQQNFLGNIAIFVGFALFVFTAMIRIIPILFMTKHTVLPFHPEAKENLDVVFSSKTYDLFSYYRMIMIVNFVLSVLAWVFDLIGVIFTLAFAITFYENNSTPGWYFDPSMARNSLTFAMVFAYLGLTFVYWVADGPIDLLYEAIAISGGWAYYEKHAKKYGAEQLLTDVISSHHLERKQKKLGESKKYNQFDNELSNV